MSASEEAETIRFLEDNYGELEDFCVMNIGGLGLEIMRLDGQYYIADVHTFKNLDNTMNDYFHMASERKNDNIESTERTLFGSRRAALGFVQDFVRSHFYNY